MKVLEGRIDLGWANGWDGIPLIVDRCISLKHGRSDIDVGPPNRGTEHVVECEICNYIYRYDSSD